MPTTRSASNAKQASSSSIIDVSGAGSRSSDIGGLHDELQGHLSALQHGIQDLTEIQEALLGKNRRLQDEIDRLHNETEVSVQPSPVRSGRKSNPLLHMRVKELELEVRRLKKARALDREKIRQLRLKEARKEAEDLQDELLHGVPDVAHEMKKVVLQTLTLYYSSFYWSIQLLEQFHRAINSPSLGDDEECSICIEALELNKCSSLPCQHIYCDSCLSKMDDGENISCPQCRKLSDVESLEAVEFTATQQWDQLLEIAQRFAEMEGRMGPDTSEEEEEETLRENLIDDDDVEASTVSQEHDTTPDAMQEEGSDRDEREKAHVPYSRSGMLEKRRRMKQLASQREHKRLRW
ncbi:hypothetical protein BJV78DRAFT_481215 [Lactifluus subvellereus]|nr:hypothetical protein BJV78DRAFT_481215 [Lactifluus subvellereus]